MEDKFDGSTKNYTVDLKEYATLLYKQANGQDMLANNVTLPNIMIEETTLTGITNYKKRMSEDTQWQTKEPITSAIKSSQSLLESIPLDKVEQDKNGFAKSYVAHLEPQRIRAFKITYKQ